MKNREKMIIFIKNKSQYVLIKKEEVNMCIYEILYLYNYISLKEYF